MVLHEARIKIQRFICWLFGHKDYSPLRKSETSGYHYIFCFDCEKVIWLDDKDSKEVTKLYVDWAEEEKLINEVMDEKEKSIIKVREQKRRDGVFAKQKRDKHAKKRTKKN